MKKYASVVLPKFVDNLGVIPDKLAIPPEADQPQAEVRRDPESRKIENF